jgi:hypothetical protein
MEEMASKRPTRKLARKTSIVSATRPDSNSSTVPVTFPAKKQCLRKSEDGIAPKKKKKIFIAKNDIAMPAVAVA